MCVCICIYVYLYVYILIYMYLYVYIYIYIYLYTHIYIYIIYIYIIHWLFVSNKLLETLNCHVSHSHTSQAFFRKFLTSLAQLKV